MIAIEYKKAVPWLTDTLLCTFVAYVGWRCINYASDMLLPSDAAIFANISHHLVNGKLLYRDVREHKQPVVFVINALALKFGDGTFNSIRAAERYFAVGAAIAFFLITVRTFVSSWIAATFTIIFLVYFYCPTTFSFGNFTEEYGTVLIILGVFCAIEAVLRENALLTLLSGTFFSMSLLTKEPFLLSILPWVVYLLSGKEGRVKRFRFLIVGATFPFLLFFVYLILTGTLANWLDMVYFTFGMATEASISRDPLLYKLNRSAHVFSTFVWYTRTVDVFFLLGVISIFQKSFLKKYRYVPAVFPAWLLWAFLRQTFNICTPTTTTSR